MASAAAPRPIATPVLTGVQRIRRFFWEKTQKPPELLASCRDKWLSQLWCTATTGGSGQRLSRKLVVAHRGVVSEDRHHGRVLHHVIALHAVVEVHVRVMSSGVVLEAVDHELKSRHADLVERH